MRTIQTRVTVNADRILTLQLPEDVEPGEHQVVVVMETRSVNGTETYIEFPVDHYGSWPAELSLRREDMYGDDGR